MAIVIGVRFRRASKVYFFDPNGTEPEVGQAVIVETARGVEYADVVAKAREVPDERVVQPLRRVVRLATPEDIQKAESNQKKEAEAFHICQEKIARHGLEMKLVSVEYAFDASKITFYFTADNRVDFRELVKDLASVFRMRIELRQIGVRDEAKLLGGLGACGRPICCGAFLNDFQPVSIKMAKEQNLSLNPTKISGLCGRLMCCLKYEQDAYEAVLKRLPRIGRDIVTPDGTGVLTEVNAIQEKVRVRIRTSEDDFDIREYALDDVRKPGPDDRPAERESPRQERKQARSKVEQELEQEQKPEEPKHRRYPHQKAPKNMSTEEFLAKIQPSEEAPEEPERPGRETKAEKRPGKRADKKPEDEADQKPPREHARKHHRGGRGHKHGEKPADKPAGGDES